MPDIDPIIIQYKAISETEWRSYVIKCIPVYRPVKIRIENYADDVNFSHEQMEELIGKILSFTTELGATHEPGDLNLVEPGEEDNLLEVLLCDKVGRVPLIPRVELALKKPKRAWVLPIMNEEEKASRLDPSMGGQNIAFWQESISEVALTVLARGGVTSFDRRVFISYRRVETAPVAEQLFDALTKRNFLVFVDTVSIDPGVDFQERLMEQLADKSMVVLLHSKTFSTSKWTMEEVNYARDHKLSLHIFRLPSVDENNDPLVKASRAGDVTKLREDQVIEVPKENPSASDDPEIKRYKLSENALQEVVKLVVETHDKEMISRLMTLRTSTLEALNNAKIPSHVSSYGASIFAQSPAGHSTVSFFPTSRPPGLPELYEASTLTVDIGEKRIVVGNISSFLPERKLQLNWTVDGRNVSFIDVSMLDETLKKMQTAP